MRILSCLVVLVACQSQQKSEPTEQRKAIASSQPHDAAVLTPKVAHDASIDAGPKLIALEGSVELATYCHRTKDRNTATWLRVEEGDLRRPKAKHCYLPWADSLEGWVDLDFLKIGLPPCADDKPSRAQRQAMMTPKFLLLRVPADATGKRIFARVRSMSFDSGEKTGDGWEDWRELLDQTVGTERVFEIPMKKVRGEAHTMLLLEVSIEGTTASDQLILHWPTSC